MSARRERDSQRCFCGCIFVCIVDGGAGQIFPSTFEGIMSEDRRFRSNINCTIVCSFCGVDEKECCVSDGSRWMNSCNVLCVMCEVHWKKRRYPWENLSGGCELRERRASDVQTFTRFDLFFTAGSQE